MSQDHDSESSSTPSTKRRRAPKGELRRAALLDAATAVFAKDGYAAASMRDVAEIAGITTVGLLHHFPNKVSLLRALIDRRDQRVTAQFAELERLPTLDNFLAFVRMSMNFSVQSLLECQASMMIGVESLSDKHPAWPWYQEKFALTHAHAQAHLASLLEQGEIHADVDVQLLATEIFAVMDGLQIQWLRAPEQIDVEAAFDAYLQRLANGIRA
ncbi:MULTISPECIES: TetR/AcrR family transcriptional regulator [Pseudomonas]|uniref:AcrR family transcriptional regulator n=1 Tax=Pseudomonas hunanensis TaxID=1247546 RepID=A0ACC6JYU8_9PSED|nr:MULTISPECIES: TetR/AcrR family transcriptional regulator [Pseudomonas]MBP2262180.1 AcrR family transcriptional regulator [Pseudomonas sp. BP8]MDR6711390.1 AcrR family transcriptional regulator [Pseudomonas hunanensis]HDS1733106.1 TetR/AcrR family transcriptional regulator [Pseudomonas putida]